jgi:hypothetical protein
MDHLSMMRKRPASLPPLPPQPTVIVGFDSEWTRIEKGRNRVLSYQLVVLNAESRPTSETFVRLEGATRRSRKSLTWLLSVALMNAVHEGVIPRIPDKLVLASHFARADLTTLRDFDEIKRRLKAIRKTYATTDKPVSVRIATPRGEVPCAVTVVDTTLQCAAKTPLEKLGDALGVPKVDLPDGFEKDRMDIFLSERPAEFESYAMTDARISALWATRTIEIMRSLGLTKHVPTLGAASVAVIQQEITSCGIDTNEFLGRDKSRRGKPRPKPNLVEAWAFAAQCYHGGTNTIFAYGLSPEGRDLIDVDLKSAYVTALAISQVPDWSTARQTKDLAELAVIEEAMTFICARFEFPVGTRFPNLPVRASKQRGLIYPLRGESWCTGPELVVALGMGAKIEVRSGWRIDGMKGAPIRPLEGYARRINDLRARAEVEGDKVRATILKEIGNSGYGKFAQAVASMRIIKDDVVLRRTFDTEWGETGFLGPSAITQPMFAAYCTGLVRAALGEALARLPPSAWAASATTDGFLFAGSRKDVDETGPVAQAFVRARCRITPSNPDISEMKHRVPRVLLVKTRGCYTVAPPDWKGDAVLAQAGYRLPDAKTRGLDDLRRSAVWIEMFRRREYDAKVKQPVLTSLRDQHNKGLDLQLDEDREVRWNADPDLKNKPVNVRDIEGRFAADTVPWATINEFEDARDGLDLWRVSQRHVIKTAQDYLDMQAWAASRGSRKAVGTTAQNSLPPLARAVMLATIYGTLGVQPLPYASIASVLSALCQVPVTVTTVKNAKRRGVEPDKLERSIAFLTVADEEFAVALLAWRPIAWPLLCALCAPGSMAAQQIDFAFQRAKDEWDYDHWLDEEPDYEPEYEPEIGEDEPDDDFTAAGEADFEVLEGLIWRQKIESRLDTHMPIGN